MYEENKNEMLTSDWRGRSLLFVCLLSIKTGHPAKLNNTRCSVNHDQVTLERQMRYNSLVTFHSDRVGEEKVIA